MNLGVLLKTSNLAFVVTGMTASRRNEGDRDRSACSECGVSEDYGGKRGRRWGREWGKQRRNGERIVTERKNGERMGEEREERKWDRNEATRLRLSILAVSATASVMLWT